MRDLVVLVPDKDTEHLVRGALGRWRSLGIHPIDFEVRVDPGRDGGVRRRGVQILQVERLHFSRALLLLDYEGSGATQSATDLESHLDAHLFVAWGSGAKAIVIEPEVDVWMWGAETHLREVLGWESYQGIRVWLTSRGFVFDQQEKPERPKEALEAVCRRVQLPRSAASYEALARRVSLARCQDPAFRRLRNVLVAWFPASVETKWK